MTDYFAVFKESRRPWLDPDLLKEKFTIQSALLHPDRCQEDDPARPVGARGDFAELNAAYNCLRQPRSRLQHLIELETGMRPHQVQEVPGELMESFLEVASACREADAILSRKPVQSSPLLQLEYFETAQNCADKLLGVQQRIDGRIHGLLAQIRGLDQQWATGENDLHPKLVSELSAIHQLLSYFERWSAQLRERALQLTL